MRKTKVQLSNQALLWEAAKESFYKLHPRVQWRNPVMFITYVGAICTTFLLLLGLIHEHFSSFELQITLWLWFTVIFANFSEAVAEGRGKAQAASLRTVRTQMQATLLERGKEKSIDAATLKRGDCVVCRAGELIPADGEVIEGVASVDEAAITGESAPVIRASGSDFSAVTGGTRVISDRIVVRVTAEIGKSFIDRMIALVEGAKRQKTPNELALSILLSGLTLVLLLSILTLKFFADYSASESHQDLSAHVTVPILIALLVCLIPTTISGLMSAVGIAGMDRLIRFNVIAKSGRAIEAAGDVDVLLIDKTGTITLGNRRAVAFIPAQDVTEKELAEAAQQASLSDETAEGRSVVVLAKERFSLRAEALDPSKARFIPFSAHLRMSGIDFLDTNGKVVRSIRKGAIDAIRQYLQEWNTQFPAEMLSAAEIIAKQGGTPLAVVDSGRVLGLINLKDVIKGGISEKFAHLRKMGVRTVMITGDNLLTAAAVAAEAGVDDFIGMATPEKKLERIREEQSQGHLVAMTGDGTNDAPALAQADVGVVMNTGTQAAREAGNMVDLDSDPTKLIHIVGIGKQLLMTRGSLTTFSIANDVAKYCAILPAIFGSLYLNNNEGGHALDIFNIMSLSSPGSAILSAIIFNALIIIALIPLALKGVSYRPWSAGKLLRRNIFLYGVGGLLIPFLAIKVIDLAIIGMGWVQ